MRRRIQVAIALILIALAGCALVEGLLGPALFTDDEICDEVKRIWSGCNSIRETDICLDVVDCMRPEGSECRERWDTWVRCLRDSEPSCSDVGARLPCAADYDSYMGCIGGDNLDQADRDLGSCLQDGEPKCGDLLCQPDSLEDPDNCGRDCPEVCSGATDAHCTAYRTGACSECECLEDDICDPFKENAYTCPHDCSCDDDGICDTGESAFSCPWDCACNFDGNCDTDETETSCVDCVRCDADGCPSAEGESCQVDTGCLVPLICAEGTTSCRLPCLQNGGCPSDRTCDTGTTPNLCLP
ncbi:MAG: hypothetical protein ABIJ09_07920 [Pseudomonadota bacterium]